MAATRPTRSQARTRPAHQTPDGSFGRNAANAQQAEATPAGEARLGDGRTRGPRPG